MSCSVSEAPTVTGRARGALFPGDAAPLEAAPRLSPGLLNVLSDDGDDRMAAPTTALAREDAVERRSREDGAMIMFYAP